MLSERILQRIGRLLDQADDAVEQRNWPLVRECVQAVLALDPENTDAHTYLTAADRALGPAAQPDEGASPYAAAANGRSSRTASPAAAPAAFNDGRYVVKQLLGEGGRKTVYLAHDSLLDRDVALALIKTEGLDDIGRERVRREAQAMGRLGAHPHIVSVFDLGDFEGQPYLVTELMNKGDVAGLLDRAEGHRLPIEQGLRIAEQVCLGLEFAHRNQIVHRDLKPSNVWLTGDPSGSSGQVSVKIGDFGLAVATDRGRLTQSGLMVGTATYVAPEQAMGGEPTPQADLYSLGAMLYEILTGRPPFIGDEPLAIITQHLNAPPVAPSWHRPDVPPALEALTLRLLEKDPVRRPGSAVEVRQALLAVGGKGAAVGEVTISSVPASIPPAPSPNPLYGRVFVGRETELRPLQSSYDAALSGQGGLAMVIGEPGIGKTALCEQLATYVALRGGRTLVGHCYEEGSLTLPYLPFVEALRSYVLAREPEMLRQELGSGAADVARVVSEVREKLELEARAAGDPEDDRWRLYQAITGFMRNAATVQPLLVVLEDLHWADRGTLDYLMHLSRNLAGARLLIVGTYRDVEVDRAHPLSGALAELRRAGSFARVVLRGLTPDEVQRMINRLQGQEVRWSFAEAVHRQTEGNPLFIQEVLRYLVEEGIVTRQAGRWEGRWRQTGETPPELRIPEGLRDVVGKRLSRLSDECNRLLSVAAVIGRDFGLDTLQRVAGIGEEPLVAAVEEAVRLGVLEERARPGHIGYRFAHAFFRQTLYEELLAPRRLRLHQHVARALEDEYGARPEEHAAELADHYAQSTDRRDLEQAVRYSRMAAERAVGVYAYTEAARLLEQALGVQEVVDPDDQRARCQLLLALAEVLCPAGEPQRAVDEIAEEAFRLAEALEDGGLASAVCRIAFEAASRYGGMIATTRAPGRHWAERADRHAEPGSPARIYADLALGRAAQRAPATTLAEGWARYRRALEASRDLGDRGLLYECAAQMLTGRLGHWDEALALAREVADLPRVGISPWTAAVALEGCGAIFLAWGDRNRAEGLWREVAEMAERARDPTIVAHSILQEIILATLDGRLEGALEATGRLHVLMDEAGSALRGLQFSVGYGLRTHFYLGRAEEKLDGLRRFSELMGPGPAGDMRLGLALAYAGRTDEARDLLARAAGAWRRTPPTAEANTVRVQQVLELAVLLEDRAAVELLLPPLAPLAHIVVTRSNDLTCIARHAAAAAALLGDHQQAKAYYAQALEVCQRVRFRPEIALIRLGLAELALDKTGLEHLDFAIEELRAMGMRPALERALTLQAGYQERAGRARPAYPDGLSEREVEVLRLIAAGKSNRDIAEELVISPNTVARHVSNVFGKTGATNRVEAASYATRHGLVQGLDLRTPTD